MQLGIVKAKYDCPRRKAKLKRTEDVIWHRQKSNLKKQILFEKQKSSEHFKTNLNLKGNNIKAYRFLNKI